MGGSSLQRILSFYIVLKIFFFSYSVEVFIDYYLMFFSDLPCYLSLSIAQCFWNELGDVEEEKELNFKINKLKMPHKSPGSESKSKRPFNGLAL